MTARAAGSLYRLLVLDIDGTLLRSDKTISPRTLAAVEGARRRGVRVILATGRRHPAARRIAEQLGGDLDLVLHNGALIIENGAVLRCRPLPRALALRAVAVGRSCAADPVVHCGHGGEGKLMIEGIEPSNTLLVYYLDRSHPDVTSVPVLDDALQGLAGRVEDEGADHLELARRAPGGALPPNVTQDHSPVKQTRRMDESGASAPLAVFVARRGLGGMPVGFVGSPATPARSRTLKDG